MSYASRVEAGAQFLDSKLDYDWRKRIALTDLDLGQSLLCVLGQLFLNYGDGLVKLDIGYTKAEELGFIERDGIATELTHAWRKYIAKTRVARASQPTTLTVHTVIYDSDIVLATRNAGEADELMEAISKVKALGLLDKQVTKQSVEV